MPSDNSFRLPDFIGVGPPRTATTWLHEILAGHVGLPNSVKETDFFVYRYDNGLEWYASHFRNCPLELPMGEFSPNYFIGAQTRERIARDIPGCRIICTLRDPVERIYSHYRKAREGEYVSGTFEECLEKRSDLLEWSKYAVHVAAWRRLFGKDNVLVLIQEDLKANPQNFLDQVTDFIGIPRIRLADSEVRDKLVNAIPNQARHPRIARAARKLRDRLQANGGYWLVNFLKKTGLRNFVFSGGSAFEAMRPEMEARLREFYRPEVEALEKMLGRDFSAWKTGRKISKRDASFGISSKTRC